MSRYNYEIHDTAFPLPELPFIIHRNITRPEEDVINWHSNIEILCCTGGSGKVLSGTKTFRFCQGDIYIANSDTLHCVTNENMISFHCIIIDSQFLKTNCINPSKMNFDELINDKTVYNAFVQIIQDYTMHPPALSPIHAAKLRHNILGFVLQLIDKGYCKTDTSPNDTTDRLIKDVIRYIKQHVPETITLQNIADRFSVSKYHLARQFKHYTGTTIFSYINHLRCTEALHKIHNGMSVSEAAASCGFNNTSYFTRTFKKHIGSLPKNNKLI